MDENLVGRAATYAAVGYAWGAGPNQQTHHICPNCGYCPCCQRINNPVVPYYPPYPGYPQPYIGDYPWTPGPKWISTYKSGNICQNSPDNGQLR